MTGRDFMDITAYVQTTQRQFVESHFSLPDASAGRLLFAEKCGVCHTGPMALENRVSNQTWIDLGAAMWNHSPLMQTAAQPLPALSLPEMRSILAYVWETQYQGPHGNPRAGEHVFEKAGCASCHRSPAGGAPMRPGARDSYTPWSMVALGWGPARTMHQQMIARGTAWPSLTPADMNDLTAYLNSLPKR
jgi:cytochrome c2